VKDLGWIWLASDEADGGSDDKAPHMDFVLPLAATLSVRWTLCWQMWNAVP